jgi:dephospho-CoA kinase
LRVGLTGGVASGKSTVAAMFARLGAEIIDTDVIAREVVAPGQPALDEIRRVFGAELIDASGALDRRAMRRLVFDDAEKRRQLEAILHPRIRAETMRRSANGTGPYQLIVVPLLAESPLRDFVDLVLVVDSEETQQIQRLMARDAESEQQAQRMLAAQTSREARLAIADDVIRNDGDIDATRRQVEALHKRYSSRAAEARDR